MMANVLSVSFESEGSRLSGNLFVPPECTPGIPVPGIVVTGSWTTVKEQMAGVVTRRSRRKHRPESRR
jgi:hypothetical protein